jgi:hypothetical protein
MIYLLSEDPQENARMLDDKALDKQIKAVAKVLCNVHWYPVEEGEYKCQGVQNEVTEKYSVDSEEEFYKCKYSQWASECRANYDWLVAMGIALCEEHAYRFWQPNIIHPIVKYEKVIAWALQNAPDLARGAMTTFPICVPAQYIEYLSSTVREGQAKPVDIVQSYRNYYRSSIKKNNQCDGCRSAVPRSKTDWHSVPYPSGGMRCQQGKYLPEWTRRPVPGLLE